MKAFSSEIAYNNRIRPNIYRMGLRASGIAPLSKPGQFIMLSVSSTFDPLLCRPFSIHRLHLEDGSCDGIEILYRVVGRGTKALSLLSPGDKIGGFGPLGNGFRIMGGRVPILVAGGMGVAPLMALAESFFNNKRENIGLVLIGAGNKEGLLFADELGELGWKVVVSTEDGSQGRMGLVTHVLLQELEDLPCERIAIYACGPHGMLKEISRIGGTYGIPCQVSLESRMACGLGACLGCAIRKKVESGSPTEIKGGTYTRVCYEGPIFDAMEIDWNSL